MNTWQMSEEEKQIRAEGFDAFNSNKSEKDNPYKNVPRKNWWLWGWEEAQDIVWDWEWYEWQTGGCYDDD